MKTLPLALGAALAALAVSGGASAQTSPLLITAQTPTPDAQVIFGRDVLGDATLQQAQFFLSGRQYCFYDSGWRGPGFYWCGYAFRRGYGWGGPVGWHGWNGGGYRGVGSYRGGGGYRGGGYNGGGGYHGGGNVHINNSVHENVHVGGGGGGGGHEQGGGHPGGGGGDHHH